jgi:dolichol-phosphate mannosyltransferase
MTPVTVGRFDRSAPWTPAGTPIYRRAMGGTLCTLVVPTRNEAGNVGIFVERVTKAVAGRRCEIVFVDDSDDDTPAVVARVASDAGMPVGIVHRPRGQRDGGLGGAVVAGLRVAQGDVVCVMDADLQHPPEILPEILDRIDAADRPDLVVASRYCPGGRSGLGRHRSFVSRASNRLARTCFPRALRDVTDPMSGFFAVRPEAVALDALRPNGFKILMEIAVRSVPLRVAEVPFTFADRQWGDSKASLEEGRRFAAHVLRLRFSRRSRRGRAPEPVAETVHAAV